MAKKWCGFLGCATTRRKVHPIFLDKMYQQNHTNNSSLSAVPHVLSSAMLVTHKIHQKKHAYKVWSPNPVAAECRSFNAASSQDWSRFSFACCLHNSTAATQSLVDIQAIFKYNICLEKNDRPLFSGKLRCLRATSLISEKPVCNIVAKKMITLQLQ